MDTSKLDKDLTEKAVNTIKMLSVDAVEQANSGHPGLPMGCSDIAFVLWMNFLRYNPKDPDWPNRDRFVLSAGHGSMLLYSLLHLSGYDLSLDEIKNFRQFGSKTPGHPEYDHTPGVETTTGPLGQGFANGVGMALAERMLASRFNSKSEIIDHYIYAIVSDGDIMEGVAAEAASFAGHHGLGRLIYLYDDNRITIEGGTDHTFSEDVGKRFESCNWQVIKVDGYDHEAIRKAVIEGQNDKERPTLIIARTHIAKGSPNKQDKASAHGEPLGAEEIILTRENINWPKEGTFLIPDEVRDLFRSRADELLPEYDKWQKDFDLNVKSDDKLSALWEKHFNPQMADGLEERLLATITKDSIATRAASGTMMQVVAEEFPSLAGGSADLGPSTKTMINGSSSITKSDFSGKNIHFGIREHAMGSIMNGMAVSGGLIPYGSTFLVFSDYVRPAIRLSALMKQQAIYIFTHDSIFVGEDGPTHQPVEHVNALRLIPGLTVIRPSDATETAAAWIEAMERKDGPTALILTRQNLPVIDRAEYASQSNLKKGAYILKDSEGEPDIIIMASGSEVQLAIDAAAELKKENIKIRLISVPSFELFDSQSETYKNEIIPQGFDKIVAIEAGTTLAWHKYTGRDGLVIGIDSFGASAPHKDLAEHFGFTGEKVIQRIKKKWNF